MAGTVEIKEKIPEASYKRKCCIQVYSCPNICSVKNDQFPEMSFAADINGY